MSAPAFVFGLLTSSGELLAPCWTTREEAEKAYRNRDKLKDPVGTIIRYRLDGEVIVVD